MTQEKYSGELKCGGGVLSYSSTDNNWSIKVSEIRLIGEYTNSDGPHLDDYFFVFLTALDGGWHEASFYSRGKFEVLKSLSTLLSAPIEPGLLNSTDYKTRIIWPEKWKGQPLMDVLPPKKAGIIYRLFDSGERDIVPSKAMREIFGNNQYAQPDAAPNRDQGSR